jgi:hypothetical protein
MVVLAGLNLTSLEADTKAQDALRAAIAAAVPGITSDIGELRLSRLGNRVLVEFDCDGCGEISNQVTDSITSGSLDAALQASDRCALANTPRHANTM